MAEFRYRYPQNAPGKFYTDIRCLDCFVCRNVAPTIFHRDDVHNFSYLLRQPATPEELAQCQECADRCPCQAIGDDGDQHDWSVPPESAVK